MLKLKSNNAIRFFLNIYKVLLYVLVCVAVAVNYPDINSTTTTSPQNTHNSHVSEQSSAYSSSSCVNKRRTCLVIASMWRRRSVMTRSASCSALSFSSWRDSATSSSLRNSDNLQRSAASTSRRWWRHIIAIYNVHVHRYHFKQLAHTCTVESLKKKRATNAYCYLFSASVIFTLRPLNSSSFPEMTYGK